MIDHEYLINKALEKIEYVLDNPTVPKKDLIPLMNYVSALIGHLYISAHQVTDKAEARKIKDLIKGLETMVSVLKYQYRSYIDFREDNVDRAYPQEA